MKKLILSFVYSLILLASMNAQQYTFQHFVQPYEYLQGDSSLTNGLPWYNKTWDISLGFDFKFMGRNFEQFTAWNENIYFDYENEDLFIFPYVGAYLLDKGFVTPGPEVLSPISIKYDGNPGSKIFKFQVQNAGFEDGGAQDSVNFQIWLYETSNIIEFHFGPKNIVSNVFDPGFLAPGVGLLSAIDNSAYIVGGLPDNPFATFLDPNDPDATATLLTGPPPSDVVWRFTPQTSSLLEPNDRLTFETWPNPCTNWLQIRSQRPLNGSHAQVFDATGRLQSDQTIGEKGQISVGALPPGLYRLSIVTEAGLHTQTFIKQ